MNSIYLLVFISAALAFLVAVAVARLSRLKTNTLFIGFFAVVVGLLIGSLGYLPLSKLPGIFGNWLPIIFYVIAVVGSVWIFLTRRQTIEETMATIKKVFDVLVHLKPQIPQIVSGARDGGKEILVDTSALIDGRIADVARFGFIPGKLVITRFVLAELQNIADSSDSLRRAKGRRGLDVVQELKQVLKHRIETISDDVPDHTEVDAKLVHLARKRGADVLTTDYNLNKVAKIEGVRVLNVNELSQALRPVIIPGEMMDLKIVQAGKEKHQGVGYLPDGTMIVVEEGDRLVGKEVSVEIKRVLQTAAGKMFFAILKK